MLAVSTDAAGKESRDRASRKLYAKGYRRGISAEAGSEEAGGSRSRVVSVHDRKTT